jgi:hypothetical protein
MTSKVLLGAIGCEFGFSVYTKKLKIDSEIPIITPLTSARVCGKSVIGWKTKTLLGFDHHLASSPWR